MPNARTALNCSKTLKIKIILRIKKTKRFSAISFKKYLNSIQPRG
jgi:hypothetical protein